ncbi:MAG: VWA domain-containing protein, partial [Planctomycetes bacterium]|nr:VWA domain-containing protein [Planctomycetota bacterium]
ELVRSSGTGPSEILRARSESWRDVKQARVVPREKAAFAYSETVRRRVDPALVEWSGAGVFQARVFPLAPKQLHRIVIGYDVNLRQEGPDLIYSLQLPDDVSQCMVDVDVSALPGLLAEVTPEVRPFVSGGRAFYHFQDPADKTIHVRLQDPGIMMLTGQDEAGGDYFAARVTPELPADQGRKGTTHAIFLVDTSLSSNPDKFSVWLDLLEAILDRNRDQIRQFAVLFYNVESHWWKPGYTENTQDHVRQLMADASMLALEGATDLHQALAEASAPVWMKASDESAQADLFLLSDGAATWGETDVARMARILQSDKVGALFAYKTGLTGTAIETLENLARDTGGAVFSVATAQEVDGASTAHRQRPWRLLNVGVPGAEDLLIGGRPRFVYPGQTLLIVGRGRAQAEVRMHLRRGDDDQVLNVAMDRVIESEMTARAYGQVAVGQLEDLGSDIEAISAAYARHFRVPGRTCSLLMLESEADYERFDIKPEDDRFIISSRPADELIRQKLDELAQSLGDAKQSVKSWLARLERQPGLRFDVPTSLELMVDGLPPEAFEVDVPRLVCKLRRREELPKKFFQQLDVSRLDYDLVLAEAERRRDRVGATDGLKCLSSLIEASPGDVGITLDVAFSALDWGLPAQAYPLLHRVVDARPYVPSLYLAMADCLVALDRADLAVICYEIALNAAWQNRYGDVASIATSQYVQLLEKIVAGELTTFAKSYAVTRLESLAQSSQARSSDLIVTMLWNTDRTDVDLHVQEPSGEVCFYQNRDTRGGGHLTQDVTDGFGPEMYTLPRAAKGTYRILADYYSTDANRTGSRTRVYLTIYELPGQKQQRVTHRAVLLNNQKEKQVVAEVKMEQRR